MRVKGDKVEIKLTLDPELYVSIINYVGSDESKILNSFIEEVMDSYIDMHSYLHEESLGNEIDEDK